MREHIEALAANLSGSDLKLRNCCCRLRPRHQRGRRRISRLDVVPHHRDSRFRNIEAALHHRRNRRMDDAAGFELLVAGIGRRFPLLASRREVVKKQSLCGNRRVKLDIHRGFARSGER